MSNNFKKQAAQQRTAIPQIDPESAKSTAAKPAATLQQPKVELPKRQIEPTPQPQKELEQAATPRSQTRLTQVDTSETPTNRGFSMFPSRHRQVAKDLAYLEDRKPWQIIDDAIEEYVIKHYGKEHKRK